MNQFRRLWPWQIVGISVLFWPAWVYLPEQRIMLGMGYGNLIAACLARHAHLVASHIKRPPREESDDEQA